MHSARSLSLAHARGRIGWAIAFMLLAGLLFPGLAAAATSPYCPTLSATVAAGGSVTIDVSNCDGPGNFGIGWDGNQPTHGTIVISAQSGSGTQTVTYTHNGDSATSDSFPLEDENGDTITVNITITQASTPTASISVSPSSLNEDSGSAFTYTVTLSASRTSATTVNLTASGTATAGTDYSGAVSSVTVAANATTATFAITPIADTAVEPDETVTYTLASGTGYTVGSPSSATATIVNDDALALAPTSLPAGTAGSAYSQTFTTSNGTAPYSYARTAGTLPSGLSLNSAGVLSGTPTVAGSFTFTVTVTDSNAFQASRSYTLAIAAPTIVVAPTSLTAATRDSAYSQTLSASGGTAPYTFATSAGTLPTGLSLSTAGVLSGTPTTQGSYSFTVTATDANGFTGSRAYALTVAAPALALPATTLPAGTAGTAYSAAINAATGGTAPYTYALSAGTLPTGISVNSGTGALSGTPTVAGSFSFTLTVTDSAAAQATRAYTLTIAAPSIALTPASLAAATRDTAYSQTLSAGGGTAPYSYAVTSGTLPAGLSLSTAGTLAGTPTTQGSYSFTVTATDANGFTGSQAYALTVASPTLALPATTLAAGTAGTAYGATLNAATGGTAPYAYALSAGSLPAGVTFDAGARTLSGTPTVSGSFSFTVTVTDSVAAQATRSYTLTIAAPGIALAPSSLPAATRGSAYSQTLSASGGIAPYTYAVTSGTLPTGLALGSGGTLAGTPSAEGSFGFTVTATDAHGFTGSQPYTLAVSGPNVVLPPGAPLPDGRVDQAYAAAIDPATGGNAPYRYALSAGALPPGIALDQATGNLHGTPTTAGGFGFTVTVTDSTPGTPAQASRSYTLTIADAALSLEPSPLPAAARGAAYRHDLRAGGGVAPYAFAISAGALPQGVTLSGSGTLAGTPTVEGSFAFTVTVTDAAGSSATQPYTLSVGSAALGLESSGVPAAVRGAAYRHDLRVDGGVAPYAFAVSAGALPQGVTLSSSGTLAGTPTVEGSFAFTVTVTDAAGSSAAQAYTLTVGSAVPVAVDDSASTLADTAATIAVTANDAGTIDAVAVVVAPEHGTATVNGLQIVYTPAAGYSGNDLLRYTANGPGGTSAPATVTITVNARPVAVSTTASAVPGESQTVDISSSALGGPFVAATLVAVLPAGAGTASIVRVGSSARAATVAAAAADEARFMLQFTPDPAFSGQATVRFTLSNAYATSAEADVVFTVAPRRDPSADAEVRGLLDAQAESTRRFAKAQIDNFQRRLEATHHGERGFNNGLSFQPTSHCREAERGVAAQPCSAAAAERDDGLAEAGPAATPGEDARGDLGLWVGGAIRSGSIDRRADRAGVDFQTDGLSVGADYRLSTSLAVGAGLGWGRDDSDIGSNGSRSQGSAYTLALYASFHPGRHFFFDTLLGYQLLAYDLRRYVTDDGSLADGRRDGRQWIASVSTGADLQRGAMQVTPYARVDLARATLDGYAETSPAPYALRYGDMDVDTTTGNLGVRLEWRRTVAWGRFVPQLRIEYQHDFQGRGAADLSYADLSGGPFYRSGLSVFDHNRLMLGVGGAFVTDGGLSTRLEYRAVTDGDGGRDQTWMLNLEKKY